MKTFKKWMYLPEKNGKDTKEAKVISSDKVEEYQEKGWFVSPRFYPGRVGASKEEVKLVNAVVDLADGELNFDEMNRKQLDDYAMKHFKVDFTQGPDKCKNVAEARKSVKELVELFKDDAEGEG